ncbi:SETMR methyltransferase, partial [Pseudoatta argentina]
MSIQSPAKCEIRSVIRYLVWKGKTPVEVYNEVKTAYGDKGMNRTSVFKWCREFKNGRTSVHDDQRSGRPSILTDDIVEIENALRDDRRLTVDELSAMFPQISRSLLHETITETLGYRKLSARWVPKQLTDQHKLNRVEAGREFLRRYKLHGDEFLRSIVTGDEEPSAILDSFPRNVNCFPNSNMERAILKAASNFAMRGKQPYIDRYLINYESRAQSPVAGCISAVIVSHSRKLLRRLTQFRILSLDIDRRLASGCPQREISQIDHTC